MIQRSLFLSLILVIPFFAGAQSSIFTLSSKAVTQNGFLPKLYTCDSLGISPPLEWTHPPLGTKAFAVTMHHFPKDGDKHVYIVLYNIPSTITELPQGVTNIGIWGRNTQNRNLSYSPPCSKGPGAKTYILTIYALSEPVNLNKTEGVTMDELVSAIKTSTLASATLPVQYSR